MRGEPRAPPAESRALAAFYRMKTARDLTGRAAARAPTAKPRLPGAGRRHPFNVRALMRVACMHASAWDTISASDFACIDWDARGVVREEPANQIARF